MNTFLRYIEANGMKDEKIESLPASELDHFLSKFVWTHGEAGDSFQLSTQYKLTAIVRRNPHLTSQGQWVRKISRVLVAKRKSLVLTWARQRKQTASCSGHRRRRRGCPFFLNFEFGDPNPVALQRTVWWFLYNTSVSEQENISQAIRYCLPPLQFLQVQTKHRIHRHSKYFMVMWKLSRMKGSVELLSRAMRTIDFEAMFVNYVQFQT